MCCAKSNSMPAADAFCAQIAARLELHEAISVDLVALADVPVAAALVRTVAVMSGFVARIAAEVATAAAELASNAVRHGGTGLLTVQRCGGSIVVTVVDRGGGVAAALQKRGLAPPGHHEPRSGGLGHGLTAVARLMSGLEFTDREGGGIVARTWRDAA